MDIHDIQHIQRQYERFPYPPIPWLALPRRGEGRNLRYEFGTYLAFGAESSHADARILVAGAGTFEALVIAQAHPLAREIVAVDLSETSLGILKKRIGLYRIARPFSKLPPIRLIQADLRNWEDGSFDYILASNLLQHVPDPAGLLGRLSNWLRDRGILRAVTYPRASRIWMRETARYFKAQGLFPEESDLPELARQAIERLPESAIRSCFESQPETRSRAGLVDAFFNACENPLAPLQWRDAAKRAGLELVADTQSESSRSDFLIELFPDTTRLEHWERLQILDDLLELCANPILWFKRSPPQETPNPSESGSNEGVEEFPVFPGNPLRELSMNLERVARLMEPLGISIERIYEVLRQEVGPRVTAPPGQKPLPGLSITDYPWAEIRKK